MAWKSVAFLCFLILLNVLGLHPELGCVFHSEQKISSGMTEPSGRAFASMGDDHHSSTPLIKDITLNMFFVHFLGLLGFLFGYFFTF